MRQRPYKRSELCLMVSAGLRKRLLKLRAGSGHSDSHSLGSCAQSMTTRDRDSHLCFASGQIERFLQRLDRWLIVALRIGDEDNATRGLIAAVYCILDAHRL